MILAIHRRGADPFQNQVGWHLEYKVAEEEDAGAESEHLGGEAQLLIHGKRRKPDIDAIQVGDKEAQNQKWNEALRSLTRCMAGGLVRDIQVGNRSPQVALQPRSGLFSPVRRSATYFGSPIAPPRSA